MTDPIQGVNSTDPIGLTSATQSGSRASAAEPVPPGPAADSANVAETKALLEMISQASSGVPVLDEARIAALKAAIATGTFATEPQQVAQKLIELEAVLAGGKATP